jgi:hypothetical protein
MGFSEATSDTRAQVHRVRRLAVVVTLAAASGLVSVAGVPTAAAAAGHSVYTVGTGTDLAWKAGACVNNQSKSTCSIRAAITQANMDAANDLIRVPSLSGGRSYKLSIGTGPLKVTTAMFITGPGSGSVTIDAGGLYSVLRIESGSSGKTSVVGLTLANGGEATTPSTGRGGGVDVAAGSTVLLNDVVITGCVVTGPGGGILNQGSLQMIKVTVTSSSSGSTGVGNGAVFAGPGGGIDNLGNLTIDRSTIDHNDALRGGGINNTSSGVLTMSESTVSGNTARNSGGGIRNLGTLNIKFSTIADNWADSTKFQQKQTDHTDPMNQGGEEGGGIANVSPGVVHMSGTIDATNHTWLAYEPDFGFNGGTADCFNATPWAFVSERDNFFAYINPSQCNVQDVQEGQVNGLPTRDFVSSDPHQPDDPALSGLEYVGGNLTQVRVPGDQGGPYVIDGAYDPIVTPWFVCDGYDQLGNIRPVNFYGSAVCDTGSVEVTPGMAFSRAGTARSANPRRSDPGAPHVRKGP